MRQELYACGGVRTFSIAGDWLFFMDINNGSLKMRVDGADIQETDVISCY